jgi:hypothetical protein
MIKITFEIPESEWMPADNLKRCEATIEDILRYMDFPIQNMIVNKMKAHKNGDTETEEMCDMSIDMYEAKREILRTMTQNIKAEIV